MSFTPDTEEKIVQLYRLLCQCAERGAACPSNKEISARFGIATVGGITRWFAVLRARGLVEIERGHHARRATILATGARTAPLEQSAQEVRRRNAASGDGQHYGGALSLDAERALSAQERARLRALTEHIKAIGPARTCRAIVTVPDLLPLDRATLDRAFAADPSIYCGEGSEPGCSYCAEHAARYFLPRKRVYDAHLWNAIPTDSVERAFYYKCRNEGLRHMEALSRVNTMRTGRNTRNA